LGPQWSEDRVPKEKTRNRRMKMMRGGPRMAPKKVRRRELHCLSPTRIVFVLYFLILFCDLNV